MLVQLDGIFDLRRSKTRLDALLRGAEALREEAILVPRSILSSLPWHAPRAQASVGLEEPLGIHSRIK